MAEHVRVMLSEEAVDKRIQQIGEQISKDYAGKQIHLVCVLKGGSFFMCELAKRITVPVSLDFMSVSSYGSSTKSSGVVKIIKDLDEPLKDKEVIVVEDIVDSGRTLSYLLEILQSRGPRHLASSPTASPNRSGRRSTATWRNINTSSKARPAFCPTTINLPAEAILYIVSLRKMRSL